MRVLIFLCVVAAACAYRECGENEHFESCGTACPLTCDNYQNPPKVCVLRCDIGCHCDEGYVRSADGRCVKPEECPARAQECGENEHFESCGTACPLTCDNYQNPPKACVLRCDIGCHCDKGYVRSADGRCVKPEECPARAQEECGQNEKWTDCGTDCPLTCENYSNPPKICNLMCRIGCECKPGFVRSRDGRCVRPNNCPVDARRPVEKSCTEKPEKGFCRALFRKFYYDAETGTCKRFIWGGCQGNGNRYNTEEECMQNCAGVGAKSLSSSACDQPAETGVCRGFFPRFYFDRTTGRCESFVYGGCGGNENNFETKEECNRECAGASSAANVCELPAETGPCRARIPKYYFDKATGSCKLFIYGGCRGNQNSFDSPEECMSTCA